MEFLPDDTKNKLPIELYNKMKKASQSEKNRGHLHSQL